jgi:transcriptional regulator with XRE-family HTH domain
MNSLQERLKSLRKKLGLTQGAFGETLGLKDSLISRIESGQVPLTDKNVELLCLKHNVNETWLRDGEGEMFNEQTPDWRDLLETFRKLSPSMRKCNKKLAHTLLETQSSKSE